MLEKEQKPLRFRIQKDFEELIAQKDQFRDCEERKVGSLDLFLFTNQSELNRKYSIPPKKIAVGSVMDNVLFIRSQFFPSIITLKSKDEYDYNHNPNIVYVARSESVSWRILPPEGPIQTLSYRPATEWRYPYIDEEEQFHIGFEPLFHNYFQNGEYDGNGNFMGHCYRGTESHERRNWSTVRPVSLLGPDVYPPPWLSVNISEENAKVHIDEFLGTKLVQGFTLPKHIDPVVWKDLLFDKDNKAIFDLTMPWLKWFNNLGVTLTVISKL